MFVTLIQPANSYEIKCRHGNTKYRLSCTFNYIQNNETLAANLPSDFRPLTKHISHITLGISNLTTLPNDTFNLLPNLHSLSARADIRTLTRHQFKNASRLMILNFGYNNQLTKLESNLFKYASSLEYIDLGFNQLNEVEDKAFHGLSNLRTLFMESNLISEIHNNTFFGTKNLQRLELSRNAISIIETGAFLHMSKLKILQLNQNRLSRLQSGIFSGFQMIERIDLSVNEISEIEDGVFDNLTTLNILELGFNRLFMLPDGVFLGTLNLKSIFLAYNQFTEIPSEMGNLTQLDMSFNPIQQIDPEVLFHMNSLDSLEIRGCNLTELPNDLFTNQLALGTLDLSENHFPVMNWTIFEPLVELRFLKLEANQINEAENFTEIKSIMPKLEFINLSRNEIDCDTVIEMIGYFKNNTIEFEFGEEVDIGCQLLPLSSRSIQAFKLSNAKFNDDALKLINFVK